MNLNEGLTKIIKEYPSIREYANIKEKKKRALLIKKWKIKKRNIQIFWVNLENQFKNLF